MFINLFDLYHILVNLKKRHFINNIPLKRYESTKNALLLFTMLSLFIENKLYQIIFHLGNIISLSFPARLDRNLLGATTIDCQLDRYPPHQQAKQFGETIIFLHSAKLAIAFISLY